MIILCCGILIVYFSYFVVVSVLVAKSGKKTPQITDKDYPIKMHTSSGTGFELLILVVKGTD